MRKYDQNSFKIFILYEKLFNRLMKDDDIALMKMDLDYQLQESTEDLERSEIAKEKRL